jgi:hypothetical protein
MLPIKRPGRVLAAAAAAAALLAAATPAAQATSRMTMSSSINPNKGPIGSPINLSIGFTIDPAEAGATPDTISRVTLLLPPNARPNGRLFPACSAQQINAAKSFARCPKGSKIGTGRGFADVTAVPVEHVPYTLTFFNGSRAGNKITVHARALRPVDINLAFDATITRIGGRYGYRVQFNLPDGLKEIYPGWFAQVRTMQTKITGSYKVRGRTIPYIQSTTLCPKSLSVPAAATFDFLDGSKTDTTSRIACRR